MLSVLGVYLLGILSGIAIIRYGIGLGSRLHIRAMNNIAMDEDVEAIEQEFTK